MPKWLSEVVAIDFGVIPTRFMSVVNHSGVLCIAISVSACLYSTLVSSFLPLVLLDNSFQSIAIFTRYFKAAIIDRLFVPYSADAAHKRQIHVFVGLFWVVLFDILHRSPKYL